MSDKKTDPKIVHHVVYSTKGGCGKTAFSLLLLTTKFIDRTCFLNKDEDKSSTARHIDVRKAFFDNPEPTKRESVKYLLDVDFLGTTLMSILGDSDENERTSTGKEESVHVDISNVTQVLVGLASGIKAIEQSERFKNVIDFLTNMATQFRNAISQILESLSQNKRVSDMAESIKNIGLQIRDALSSIEDSMAQSDFLKGVKNQIQELGTSFNKTANQSEFLNELSLEIQKIEKEQSSTDRALEKDDDMLVTGSDETDERSVPELKKEPGNYVKLNQLIFNEADVGEIYSSSDKIAEGIYIIPSSREEKDKERFHVKSRYTPLLRYDEFRHEIEAIVKKIKISEDAIDTLTKPSITIEDYLASLEGKEIDETKIKNPEEKCINFIYDMPPNSDGYTESLFDYLESEAQKDAVRVVLYLVSNNYRVLKCNIDWLKRYISTSKGVDFAFCIVHNETADVSSKEIDYRKNLGVGNYFLATNATELDDVYLKPSAGLLRGFGDNYYCIHNQYDDSVRHVCNITKGFSGQELLDTLYPNYKM